MSYFESSVRVPLLVHYPALFPARHVSQNVSTLDILPTLVDLAGTALLPTLPIDGHSLHPFLVGGAANTAADSTYAEYCGEGTVAPLMMIRRGPWKYITCPVDPDQLYNLSLDPLELTNLASSAKTTPAAAATLAAFRAEAARKWDFPAITAAVHRSQRQRRLVWSALRTGAYTSWDFDPVDDGREKYIRSHLPLDDLELRARFPVVDARGAETAGGRVVCEVAGARGE